MNVESRVSCGVWCAKRVASLTRVGVRSEYVKTHTYVKNTLHLHISRMSRSGSRCRRGAARHTCSCTRARHASTPKCKDHRAIRPPHRTLYAYATPPAVPDRSHGHVFACLRHAWPSSGFGACATANTNASTAFTPRHVTRPPGCSTGNGWGWSRRSAASSRGAAARRARRRRATRRRGRTSR